ncbi:MAG TPA: PaaI family thioesterase [Verrucomicrobiae bacterium]|nr:PaaI family thioesterase [Verrucomicrobiae bacterium]
MNETTINRAHASTASSNHPRCVACSPAREHGWQLKFTREADGSVNAAVDCTPEWEGYPNRLHGGAIAMLLDAAMTHCLFANGEAAVTAELSVRYREAVTIGCPACVKAWLVNSSSRLHRLRAELFQEDRLKAVATGTFVPLHEQGPGSQMMRERPLDNSPANES